jgi:serine/threonine-protein kinase
VDGKPVTLPALLDLAGDTPHQIVAEKVGFDRFETSLTFQDGKAEAQVEIALLPSDPNALSSLDAKALAKGGAATGPGDATLHINSIPPSNVLLDGKPLGRTPRLGVVTGAGAHVIVFVHPTRGKKTVSVRVAPGQAKTVSARL